MEIQFNDPVKQQIWQTLRALNDAWTKGNPDDLVNFFHQDMLAITPIDQFRREGRAKKGARTVLPDGKIFPVAQRFPNGKKSILS